MLAAAMRAELIRNRPAKPGADPAKENDSMPEFLRAVPYADDAMNLPVGNVDAALPFYETVMAFKLVSRGDAPHKSAVLLRDRVQIGLAENGGDPTQEGCFFEVDDGEAAFAELLANGLDRTGPGYRVDKYGETSYRVFFVVAPDGLCYCLGQRLP
jgi:catechol 2,3-dioxygenase-like lactoylglutathione lyase family enzyme